MNIPISFKIDKTNRKKYFLWIQENNLLDKITFDWRSGVITFEDLEDATVFQLATGVPRYITLVEEKLRNEESND